MWGIRERHGQQVHSRYHGEAVGKPFLSHISGKATGVAGEGEFGMDGLQISAVTSLSLVHSQ